MRAAIHIGPGNVTVTDVPDPGLLSTTDAIVRVTRSAICGSDLWAYNGTVERPTGSRLGHEFLGYVESTGADVRTVTVGDLVIAPFRWSDNSCSACRDGLQSSCAAGGLFGAAGADGGQGEAVRVPHADGTLLRVPRSADSSVLAGLLAATDVLSTGLHGATMADVGPGATVAVIGDGAVGLCAVLAASALLSAQRTILVSTHPDRSAIGRRFGATDVVGARGREAIDAVRELTGGRGVGHTVEAVGTRESWNMAIGMTRDGGSIGAVGVPHTAPELSLFEPMIRNLAIRIGVAPARHYLPDLIIRIVEGSLDPSPVFDRTMPLSEAATGYAAMAARESVKVMLTS